jgi:hypothetical protein
VNDSDARLISKRNCRSAVILHSVTFMETFLGYIPWTQCVRMKWCWTTAASRLTVYMESDRKHHYHFLYETKSYVKNYRHSDNNIFRLMLLVPFPWIRVNYKVQICLLGCTAVQNNCRPTFQRYMLPPSSGQHVPLKRRSTNYFTRQYIPEDKSELHTHRRENLKSHTCQLVCKSLGLQI